ncbi:MAG: TIGR02221 family CRISPR-associated protein [bacterium]|nr:TIGR02221 family CRISPR-associated protein [bacterium]
MLTLLGVNSKQTRYRLDGREVETDLAPVALLELLPASERPERVLALCTAEAKEDTGRKLIKRLADKCDAKLIDVPSGHDQEHVEQFLRAVTSEVPDGVDLTVDITHGFRHFSFLTYAGLLYLAELRSVRIYGVYYGLLEYGEDGSSPFLDLHPLLELPRWTRALHTLSTTGSALPIADLLSTGSKDQPRKGIREEFRDLSEAYLAALPLELGERAMKVKDQRLKAFGRILRDDHHLPLSNELVGQLAEILTPQALEGRTSGSGWKGKLPLSKNELSRQAGIIDSLLGNGHVPAALGLMHEWTLSWVIFIQHGDADDWLSYRKVRSRARNLLGAFDAIGKEPDLRGYLTDQQQGLGKYWDDLTELRNGYAHHGMRPQVLIRDPKIEKKLESVADYWNGTLRSVSDMPLSIGGATGGRILVSPIGKRPGVLYSAVKACWQSGGVKELNNCLLICSKDTERSAGEALKRAEFEGDVTPLRLQDPFGGGSREIERLAKQARRHLLGADEVLINVTGGTTLMGLVAEQIASQARRFARPTRRFGLIDRRPPQMQDADPYQLGESFWLDQKEEAGG